MSLNIRQMEHADVAPVAGIVAATPLWQRYGQTQVNASASLTEGLGRGDPLRVAESDGKLAGFCWVLDRGMFGRAPYLKWIGVAPGATGGGVGKALLLAAEEAAAAAKPELSLLCSDFNTGARRFYEREGYLQVGELPSYVLPGVNEVLYFKRLS